MASASEVRAGKAYVELGTKDKTAGGLKAAEARLKAFGARLASIGKVAAIGLVGAGAATLALVKKFADAGSALNDMSARTGMSVEALGELGHAASMVGSSLEEVEIATKKMQDAIANAASGNEAAAAAFAKIGLSAESLANLTPDQQLQTILEAIGKLPNPAAKASAAIDLLGKSGTKLLPLANAGANGIAALREEAIKLGRMSTEDAEKADAFGDAWDRVTAVVGSVANGFASTLAPTLTAIADSLTNGIVVIRDWIAEMGGLGGAANAAWLHVQIAFQSGIAAIDDAMGGWLSYAQTFFSNFGGFAELAWVKVKLGFVTLGKDIAFFFTDKLPAAANWFAENWRDIFTDLFNYTKTVFTNLAGNIVKIIKNIPGLISGSVSFGELWTPLTEGFKRATKELQLPERVQSDLETRLANERDALQAGLGAKVNAAPGERQKKIDELQKELADIKQAASAAAAANAGDDAMKAALKGKYGFDKGSGPDLNPNAKAKQSTAAIGSFSAFAAARIGAGSGVEGAVREGTKVMEKVQKAAEDIARNTEEGGLAFG